MVSACVVALKDIWNNILGGAAWFFLQWTWQTWSLGFVVAAVSAYVLNTLEQFPLSTSVAAFFFIFFIVAYCGEHYFFRPNTSSGKIQQLITQFERHAAEEAFIVYRMRGDLNFVNYLDATQKQPHKNDPLTETEFFELKGYLEVFDRLCIDFGLESTHLAIKAALIPYERRVIDLSVAYGGYHNVSEIFKSEVGAWGLVRASSGPK